MSRYSIFSLFRNGLSYHENWEKPVSYTHLTLPTILRV